MRKRKVLALLLALSMAVSTNGMAVYAAEPNIAVTAEESGAEQTETGDLTEPGQSGDSSDLGDKEEGNSGDSDHSKDENEGDSSDKSDQNKEDQDEDEQTEMTETPIDSEEGDGADDKILDDEKETPDEEQEKLTEEETDEVRMETFTDETGMTITYDAVMATSFDAEVRGGTLYSVETDANDVLDLREKTEIEIIDSNIFDGKDKTAIKYIMLPKSVKTIGASAFEGCSSLKGISIPSRLTEVGKNAFKGCTSLTQLALPNSVTSIGEGAFQGDSRLFMVHMVSAGFSKLETIGKDAFSGCSSLEFFCSDNSYYLPDSITTIGDTAFYGCRKLTQIKMSDTITSIGTGAFQNCTGISEVTLSSGLLVIPENAFSGCSSLVRITFGNNNIDVDTAIATRAFANCSKLGNIELPEQVNKVCANAFEGCTSLKRVYIKNGRAFLEENAFPNRNSELCLVATATSTAAKYADAADVRFVSTDESDKVEYYQYKSQISGAGTDTGLITLKVTKEKSTESKTLDINKIKNVTKNGTNAGNGVTAGTICYLQINYGGLQVKPVAGSIKCNGTPLTYSKGWYSFSMPIGGATITAEFEMEAGSIFIQGDENSVEGRLSSDATFVVNSDKSGSATLKVGQSTKFYLTDSTPGSDGRIPTSKVTYYISKTSPKGIISVDKEGTVKALKQGTAVVCADVKSISGVTITRMVTIKVEQTKIDHISMLVPTYDKNSMSILKEGVDEEGSSTDQITGISVPTKKVTKNYTFDLKAVAFSSKEDDEAMAVVFTWATSDAKIAKLSKTSTTAASSVNTVTIPIKASGEATITVTATNADKTKETQTFVVRVEDYTPRLVASKITVNPNQTAGTTKLEIISAYGKQIKPESFTVVNGQGDFIFNYIKPDDPSDPISTYGVSVRDGLPDKTYTVNIQVKVQTTDTASVDYQMPLTIVVKKSAPSPKVAFAKKQKKINLFYANDGTEIKPVISNLGTAKVSEYSLEPLTAPGNKNYENDVKFTENFDVKTDVDGNPIIFQQSDELACNTSNKPVVTGYLVLKFEGYDDEKVVKKYKITIPTQTVAPSYVLNSTSNTFGAYFDEEQTIYLQLLDKKTKKQIDLGNGEYKLERYYTTNVTEETEFDIVSSSSTDMTARDGEDAQHPDSIKITLPDPVTGKLVMKLTNEKWADGKYFLYTYTIKKDTRRPKITLKTPTVTLNTSYPEQTVSFALASNQYDTQLDDTQEFVRPVKLRASDIVQYDKLDVSYEDGVGKVSIKPDEADKIKAGTYKFTCAVKQGDFTIGAVTLNVKVTKTVPTVTLKGTNNLNLQAFKREGSTIKYVETSEMTLRAKNLPQGYALDKEKTEKTIVCTTKGYTNAAEYFKFNCDTTENKIKVSIKDDARYLSARTYSFRVKPTYTKGDNSVAPAKFSTFTIKVYDGVISVKLSAKGKINLVDRIGERTVKNGVLYTPVFKNLNDTLAEVKLLDVNNGVSQALGSDSSSELFEAKITENGRSFYVVPKAGVLLENKKAYQLKVGLKTKNYEFSGNKGWMDAGNIKVTTAEVLPKVKTSRSTVNLYLSNKNYKTSFVISKADLKAVGDIKAIAFGEKDDKANRSFDISDYEVQKDGSLKVNLKLNNTVSYGCNTTNKITMYVKFEGQGTNTAGTAITMNVRINK